MPSIYANINSEWVDLKSVMNIDFPVGGVLMGESSLTPANIWGGTWSQLNVAGVSLRSYESEITSWTTNHVQMAVNSAVTHSNQTGNAKSINSWITVSIPINNSAIVKASIVSVALLSNFSQGIYSNELINTMSFYSISGLSFPLSFLSLHSFHFYSYTGNIATISVTSGRIRNLAISSNFTSGTLYIQMSSMYSSTSTSNMGSFTIFPCVVICSSFFTFAYSQSKSYYYYSLIDGWQRGFRSTHIFVHFSQTLDTINSYWYNSTYSIFSITMSSILGYYTESSNTMSTYWIKASYFYKLA